MIGMNEKQVYSEWYDEVSDDKNGQCMYCAWMIK